MAWDHLFFHATQKYMWLCCKIPVFEINIYTQFFAGPDGPIDVYAKQDHTAEQQVF